MDKEKIIRKAKHDGVPPLIDENCDTLILGSILSPKSEQAAFYYAHPQNRFWTVIAAVFGSVPCADTEGRKALALNNRIALWDVIESCDIIGASDNTIADPVYNDIDGLLKNYKRITRIFTTGGKAHELLTDYNRKINNAVIAEAVRLPSTSPQNCRVKFDELVKAYSVINREKRI